MENGSPELTTETLPNEAELRQQLIDTGAVREMDFARARRLAAEQDGGESLSQMLVRLGMVTEQAMAQALAAVKSLPLVTTADFPREPVLGDSISVRFLRDRIVLPLTASDEVLEVALADPYDGYVLRALALATDRKVVPKVGVASELQAALDQLYSGEGEAHGQRDMGAEAFADQDVEQLRDMASEAPVIRFVNQIIQRALESRASDIHVEPFENTLKIRYRIDGVLRDEASPPRQMGPAVISRIKIMANLDIAERRLPQDGRINHRVQGQDLDIRVSTVPTMYGESVVLRLLQRESVVLDFASLGFTPALRKQMLRALDMPHGMIIVTGPTGSGKTTTLYTALNSLNTEERKVITVEDPVEYNLEGINQIQVNPAIGLSFASALRSIVRQDPDVIMVGEMRDLETARICVQSSLTGHLVLSTLHTNDAASSITRLLEMGAEDYLLNSTLHSVLAQRLVRVLCKHCKQPFTPDLAVVNEFGLEKLANGDIRLHRAEGCELCGGIGYQGRISILEMLTMSDEIRALVLRHASATEIEQAARRQGMKTMFEDGCLKALEGVTTLEEVIRVTQEA